MILKNAEILNSKFQFVQEDIQISGEKITDVGKIDAIDIDIKDLTGYKIIPGLIDIHIHGSKGCDACDASEESLKTISDYLAENGVTSFAPASMSYDKERLLKVFKKILEFYDKGLPGAYLQGINMEGPYFSVEKRGAQNKEYIRKPDAQEFKELFNECKGIIKLVDVAPEVENAESFIKEISKLCVVSVAHTTANYEQTLKAFEWGATHCTHLFNAMEGLNHRKPGTVGAVFDSDITAELICDGIHIHPAVVRLIWRVLGPDRVVLISDAMSAAGMPEGEYSLGGQTVIVKNDEARLKDGSLAGSTANMFKCVKKAISFGIKPEDAVKAATINPAKVIKRDHVTGSIMAGKLADLVITDNDYNIKMVIRKGEIIKNFLH